MPLSIGYGYKTIHHNIGEMIAAGHSHASAVAASYAKARVSFFKRHPGGALPDWLAWPRGYRMREHYTASGAPKFTGTARMATNPRRPEKEIEQARKLFAAFAERPAGKVRAVRFKVPKAGLVFGKLLQIGYISEYDGKPYRHDFEKPSSRPLLVASSDGKSVLIVGGRLAFTSRGIEDR